MFFVVVAIIVLAAQCASGYLALPRGQVYLTLPRGQVQRSIHCGYSRTHLDSSLDEPVWSSAVSTNADLNEAVLEVINKSKTLNDDEYNECIAIVFVSSIYEYAAFNFASIHDQIRSHMKNIKYIFGCTTGAVVGVENMETLSPVEIESRASITLMVARLSKDINSSVFRLDPNDVDILVNDNESTVTDNIKCLFSGNKGKKNDEKNGSVTLLLATESIKNNLSELVSKIKHKLNTDVFGAVASSVTSLHMPKLFLSSKDNSNFDKYNNGIIGITFNGNISIQSVIARSCLPVGPVFSVEEINGREIIGLRNLEDGTIAPPLVQLEQVLETVPAEQSYLLKRELLVGTAPTSSTGNINASPIFFGQKPVSFEPLVGSITIPCRIKPGHLFQFCVRDATATRQDLSLAMAKVGSILQNCQYNNAHIMSVLLLGSMERGNKVFRHQNWESLQLYHQIQSNLVSNGEKGKLPPSIGGFYSAGTILNIKDSSDEEGVNVAIMEADSTYTFITKMYDTSNQRSSTTAVVDTSVEDIMTKEEVAIFSDINDGVIVSKRDPESAHPTRVASMDYFVPDKIPQPRNILESLLWEREKDVDRMRERFQMSKALIQAKLSEAKYPQRDLIQAIIDANMKRSLLSKDGLGIPPILVEIVRNSLHNGKLDENGRSIIELAKKYESCGAVALGANADFSTFRGQYEDVDAIKLNTKLPVFCNDLIVYGYQIFKAKSSGADVVKLMASILTPSDINYLIKVAKALRILCMVVVSSKSQLLDVLANVQGVQMISVTSRNMRIWKIEPNKATNILQDEEVRSALKSYKAKAVTEGNQLLLFQEGFATVDEFNQSKNNGVDAVILGEELLREKSTNVAETFTKWII